MEIIDLINNGSKQLRDKKIFSHNNLHENLGSINGEFNGNELVKEVLDFIGKGSSVIYLSK